MLAMAFEENSLLVTGAGSWGTALAVQIARVGRRVYLWGHDRAHIAALRRERRNSRYLPEIDLPESIVPIDELSEGLSRVRDVIIVVPCKGLRAVLEVISDHANRGLRLAWACKGIESGTNKLVHEVVEELCGAHRSMAVISGPTFAGEVAAGLPAAVAVASNRTDFSMDLVGHLHGGAFRTYTNDDIVGVEVGGAVKNVLAIAAGISDGLGFGANTRAALITRGLAEMTRLGVILGGRRETFTGLAGLGDLVLTCTDDKSRNRRLGLALAEGQSVEAATEAIGQVVEGARTAHAVDFLARKLEIEMPISKQVTRLLKGECTPRQAVQALLSREPREEVI